MTATSQRQSSRRSSGWTKRCVASQAVTSWARDHDGRLQRDTGVVALTPKSGKAKSTRRWATRSSLRVRSLRSGTLAVTTLASGTRLTSASTT